MAKRPVSVETTVGETSGGKAFPFGVREKIIFISNDSTTYDVEVNIDAPIGQNGTFTLKAGESVSDIPAECSFVYFQSKGSASSVSVRALGV